MRRLRICVLWCLSIISAILTGMDLFEVVNVVVACIAGVVCVALIVWEVF